VAAGDGAVGAAPVVHDELELDVAGGLAHGLHHLQLAVDADLVHHDVVRAVLDPEAHLARGVGEAVGADAHLEPRVAALDEPQQEEVRDGDRVDLDLLEPAQHLVHLALTFFGQLGVAHGGAVEQVVELDAAAVGLADEALEPFAVDLGQVERRPAPAEVVRGQLPEDLIDRVGLEAVEQGIVKVAGD